MELVLFPFIFLFESQLWESPDIGEAMLSSSLEYHKYWK